MLSESDLPGSIVEWLEDLLHAVNLSLWANKYVDVLHLVCESLGLAVESGLVDKDAEGSWHSSSSILGCISLKNFIGVLQEFCYSIVDLACFDVCSKCTILTIFVVTSSSWGSSFSGDRLSSQELINISLKVWPVCWMSDENNLSSSVDESDVWDSLYSKFFVSDALSISHVVVLDLGPSLSVDMVLDSGSSLINGETNQSYSVSPLFSVLLKHFLIVSHWCLAWWAPSSPEIKEQYLSFLVLNIALAILEDLVYALDDTH